MLIRRTLLPRALWASPRTSAVLALPRTATALRYYSVVHHVPVPKKRKVWESIDEAIQDVKSGDVLLSGGVWSAMIY